MSLTGSCFSSESAPGPLHHGGSKTTNSPHPSSRKGHLSTARWSSKCSPIVFDPLQFSCCVRGLFPGPTELSAVDPDAVHDHGQPARQSHGGLLYSAVPGDLHRPGLEPGPFGSAGQHDMGRLVKHDPHHLVAAL